MAAAAEAAHDRAEPLVLTARAENHLHGVDDLDDTIARLVAYRDGGRRLPSTRPGSPTSTRSRAVVAAVEAPVNVLALPGAPSVAELAAARRAARLDRLACSPERPTARCSPGRGSCSRRARRSYAELGISPEERAAAFGPRP